MSARLPRRPLLAGALAVAAGLVTGCTIGGQRDQVEQWLRSRPWAGSVQHVRSTSGPVPLPGKANITADVTCVPGTDRRALDAIRAEIEEYVASRWRVDSLVVQVDHDGGTLPITGTQATNTQTFRLLDHALADARAERVEINRRAGFEMSVTVAPESVVAYAETLAGPAPGQEMPMLRVRDKAGARTIVTAFDQADRVQTVGAAIERVGAQTPVRGFSANTVPALTPVQIEIADPSALATAFRAVRDLWRDDVLDVTVRADRLGVRGPVTAIHRLPAARDVLDAEPALTSVTVQDNRADPGQVTLAARISKQDAVAGAAYAIGNHPAATGAGLAWLVLDPTARVRLAGTPAEIADCGGPAQAVMATTARNPSVDSGRRTLRFAHGLGGTDLTELCRSMRAAGWSGELRFEVSGVSYRSTATGPARDVEFDHKGAARAQAWVDAWNATATE